LPGQWIGFFLVHSLLAPFLRNAIAGGGGSRLSMLAKR
jgi:hypothetical protein